MTDSGDTPSDRVEEKAARLWSSVRDLLASDGARYLKMYGADGKVIAVVEVMEMSLDVDQAAICARMAELLNGGAR